jgi:hypothetical protein
MGLSSNSLMGKVISPLTFFNKNVMCKIGGVQSILSHMYSNFSIFVISPVSSNTSLFLASLSCFPVSTCPPGSYHALLGFTFCLTKRTFLSSISIPVALI